MRENYTIEFKTRLVKEAEEAGNILAVAKKNNVPEATLRGWIKAKNKGTKEVNKTKSYKDLEKENEQLKKLIGEKELALNILQAAIKKKTLY